MVETTKNNIQPWQVIGRWYHILIENSASGITSIDAALKDITTYAENVITVSDVSFVSCDVKILVYNRTAESTGQFSTQIINGNLAITIPGTCDADVYIFGYFQ